MDITCEQPFSELRGAADSVRRLARSAAVALVFGALAVWGVAGALASSEVGGFVHDPVSVSTSTGTMFSLPALAPGESVTRFATVTSTGSPATVHLFATVSGTVSRGSSRSRSRAAPAGRRRSSRRPPAGPVPGSSTRARSPTSPARGSAASGSARRGHPTTPRRIASSSRWRTTPPGRR